MAMKVHLRLCVASAVLAVSCKSRSERATDANTGAPAHHAPALSEGEAAVAPAARESDKILVRAARLTRGSSLVEDVETPEGPHRSGGQVRHAWVAPDGTEIVTGYLYTGAPGPDTGYVFLRAPKMKEFKIAHTTPRRELGTIFGTSSRDIWIGGTGVLTHYDGTAWIDSDLPPGVGHVSALAVHDGELWLASSAPEAIYRRKLDASAWQSEAAPARRYDALAFAGKHVFAGTVSSISHRFPDGHWARELDNRGAAYHSFYVASDTTVFVAGGLTFGAHVPTLLRTNGDGTWTGIDAPDAVSSYAIWGRSPNEIYVATRDDVRVWRGKAGFSRTNLPPSPYLSGNAEEVFVAYEKH